MGNDARHRLINMKSSPKNKEISINMLDQRCSVCGKEKEDHLFDSFNMNSSHCSTEVSFSKPSKWKTSSDSGGNVSFNLNQLSVQNQSINSVAKMNFIAPIHSNCGGKEAAQDAVYSRFDCNINGHVLLA